MATKPNWNDLPAKYLSTPRPKVVGIVLHDTAGSGKHGDTKYLANPSDGRKVSVDFTVERDGSIWKLNKDLEKYYTAHAGRATKFKGLTNNQVTRATIGIEICQKADLSLQPLYPDAQVRNTAQLCAWLVEQFKLTTSDITTHRQIITDGSRADPRKFPFEGEGGFWQYYWEAMGKADEHEASKVITKTPDPDSPVKTHTVVRGDTLGSIAKKYYGKNSAWTLIKEANELKNDVILLGQVLKIPK